jgi:hydrogen cyanide synthase HcnC
MSSVSISETEVAVVGGGIVGAAIAYGIARSGARVTVLDEGDLAFRASRGNFALVWVQDKGLGMPAYATWSRASADLWPSFAAELREETGIDVAFERPGGFKLCLSEQELQVQRDELLALNAQPGIQPHEFEVLTPEQTRKMLPGLGPAVIGSLYSPLDGHVNSLRLFHALHVALGRRGVRYLPHCAVGSVCVARDGFNIGSAGSVLRAKRLVLAAGLSNARLAPMVGLDAPVRPVKGQILITEKAARFLQYPVLTLRQTDEGGVMIGDSQQERGLNLDVEPAINAVMASRAARMFPLIGRLNIVRSWAALRVMSPDGFPIYQESRSCPGAFVASGHSGVTLAAAHTLLLAPHLARGGLPQELSAFGTRRFHVPAAA